MLSPIVMVGDALINLHLYSTLTPESSHAGWQFISEPFIICFLALTESAEDFLRNRFAQSKLEIEAFSSLRYVGIQTVSLATDFSDFQAAVQSELENTTVRSPRQPQVVYHTLKVLHYKYHEEVVCVSDGLFDKGMKKITCWVTLWFMYFILYC
jgi:hypothetical protein